MQADYWRLRNSVLLADLVMLAVVGFGFVRFPQLTGVPLDEAITAGFLVGVIWLASLVALISLRAVTPAAAIARRNGVLLGLSLGGLWILYILVSHLAIPLQEKPTLGGLFTLVTLALTTCAVLIVSALSGWHTRAITSGLGVGFWAGLIAGVLSTLTVLLMLYLGMGFLVQAMNAGELQAFAQSGWQNRAAWYFWNEEITGSLGYFLLLVWGGSVLGSLGGMLGKLLNVLRRTAVPDAEPSSVTRV